jgi:hypothetical protein
VDSNRLQMVNAGVDAADAAAVAMKKAEDAEGTPVAEEQEADNARPHRLHLR